MRDVNNGTLQSKVLAIHCRVQRAFMKINPRVVVSRYQLSPSVQSQSALYVGHTLSTQMKTESSLR